MTLTEGVADDDVATCLRFELSISNPTTSTPQRPKLYSIFCKCGRFDRLVNLYFWDASYSNQLGKISITFAKSLSKFARRRALRKN